jgi:hypothetical protein
VIPQKKYIYIYIFFLLMKVSLQKGVFHFRLLILLCSHSKWQHVDSFCAELFLITVLRSIGLPVSVPSMVLFCSILVSSIQVPLP